MKREVGIAVLRPAYAFVVLAFVVALAVGSTSFLFAKVLSAAQALPSDFSRDLTVRMVSDFVHRYESRR